MRTTRKIISIIMCITVALSVFTIMISATIDKTVFNKNFVAENLVTDTLTEKCTEQLKFKFRVLEKKSNIPIKVFKQVLDDKPVDQIMKLNVENFFSGRNSSSHSEDMVDYFYEKCVEYLDENSLEYNEEDIRNTAVQATNIYSDCVGFSNVEHLNLYLDEVHKDIKKSTTIAAIYLVVACVLMYMMYSNTKQALKYLSQAVIASGFSGVIVAIISMVARYGLDLPITPEIYMESFNDLVTKSYIVVIIVSILVSVVGTALTLMIDRTIQKDKNRKESRFLKRLDNI